MTRFELVIIWSTSENVTFQHKIMNAIRFFSVIAFQLTLLFHIYLTHVSSVWCGYGNSNVNSKCDVWFVVAASESTSDLMLKRNRRNNFLLTRGIHISSFYHVNLQYLNIASFMSIIENKSWWRKKLRDFKYTHITWERWQPVAV